MRQEVVSGSGARSCRASRAVVKTLAVTPSEMGVTEVGGCERRSWEPSEEANAVVQVGGGAARPGWGQWVERWSDSGDAVRGQPQDLQNMGEGVGESKGQGGW